MRLIAAACFTLIVAPFAATAADVENPYRNAKVGDTLTYKMAIKSAVGNFDGSMTQTITEKSDKEATVKVVTKMLGKEQPAKEQKIDLTKDYDPTASATQGAKAEKLKDGKEKVKIGDKEYDCTWITYKVDPGANVPKGFGGESELKVWLCKDVPGMVKMTVNTKAMNNATNVTVELTEFVNKK
jgi:hypothetical protein